MITKKRLIGVSLASLAIAACSGEKSAPEASAPEVAETPAPAATDGTIALEAGDGFAARLQEALITAGEGATIKLPAGVFAIADGLSLDVQGVTILGAGRDETVLDFAGQTGAGEGLLVTSDDVTLESFTIRDTAGDGIKSKGADRIVYRDLNVEWTGEPDEKNGAYGVYPVESEHILVENVRVRGASDAGIYVGQSKNIIVRNSVAEFNVAGIEIENSSNADVYDNIARNNAGGVLVFDLPDLPVIGGASTRIFNNTIVDNNTRNFAPPGNIVASVPSGTGLIAMATDDLHVFGNKFEKNRTSHVAVTAYGFETKDERYNPLPRNVVLRDNSYGEGGYDPQGPIGAAWNVEAMGPAPAIVWDGATRHGDREEEDINLAVLEDEAVSFISLGAGVAPIDLSAVNPTPERPAATPKEEPAAVVLPHVTQG